MPCTDSRDREHPLALRFHHDRVEELCEVLIKGRDVDAFEEAYRSEAIAFAQDVKAIDHGKPHRYVIAERDHNLRTRGL